MEKNNMKNLKSKKLYLQVYDEIKNYITKNHLGPGDKLPSEMKMCEMMGVSRNVLREAIKAMEITGAVHSTPGVGIVINEFDTDLFIRNLIYDLNDESALFHQVEELRRVLELGFASAAYHSLRKKNIEALGNAVRKMEMQAEECRKTPNALKFTPKFAEADAQFHKALYSNLDNRLLKSILDFFWICNKFYKERTDLEGLELTIKKHKMLYEAASSQDHPAFCTAMKFHYNIDCDK